MERTLFSRNDLAERWGVTVRAIIKYEEEGIITRNPNFKRPCYCLEEIVKVEGLKEYNPLSPLERKRLERENIELKKTVNIFIKILSKIVNLGTESMNLLVGFKG